MEEKKFYSKNRKGEYLDYLYYSNAQTEKKPLLIYIHGAGSRGNNLSFMSKVGPIGELEKGRNVPAVVVCPQCHCDTWFELFDVLLEFIEHCIHTENIDKNRVYLCGVSMGAYAAWQVAMSRPEWFAALVPVCGGGMYWNANRLKNIPIWAFHGELDNVVRPEESVKMVEAANRNGGSARLTLYPNAAHNAWDTAFAEDEMWEWLFEQKKKSSAYHLYFSSCEKDGGIYHYTLTDGELKFIDKTVCDRPMYLNIVGDKLQAVLRSPFTDSEESGLITYKINSDGSLKQTGEIISTKGVVGCHLCEFEGNTYVANYISGSVFGTNDCLDVHTGRGLHPTRQEAPHMHFVGPSPDGKYLFAVDLGLDAVCVYDKDLNVMDIAYVPEGHGARHLAYSEDGKHIFCVNELAGSVTVFAYHNGSLTALETVSAILEPTEGNTAAAIRVKGDYVYVSHRGDDSIACLSWHDEKLQLCSVTKCGGTGPRDFIIIDDLLLCTNEKDNTVSRLIVHGAKITDTGEKIKINCPICVGVMTYA